MMALAHSNQPVTLSINLIKENENAYPNELQHMRDMNFMTDCTLKVQGREIPCHKLVLAAHSPHFHCLFHQENTNEVSQTCVNLEHLYFPALASVISYFYSGILEFQLDHVDCVVETIEYLQIPHLKDEFAQIIAQHLSVENCLGWYFFAEYYDMPKVREVAIQIMRIDFFYFASASEFLELDCDTFIDFMGWLLEGIPVLNNSALFGTASWILYDIEERLYIFYDISEHIDFTECKGIVKNYKPEDLTSPQRVEIFLKDILQNAQKRQDECHDALKGLENVEQCNRSNCDCVRMKDGANISWEPGPKRRSNPDLIEWFLVDIVNKKNGIESL